MIRIFTDGACQPNPGDMGIGVVIEWQGKKPEIISEYHGEGTNNIAEYGALHRALELIHKYEIKVVNINSDSTLMVSQMKKVIPVINFDTKIKGWKCNDADLIVLRDRAKYRIENLMSRGFKIILDYIPRELNLADTPAKNGVQKK